MPTTKLLCISTCYMPTPKGTEYPLEGYEDVFGRGLDVYEVDNSLVKKFLASGKFVPA